MAMTSVRGGSYGVGTENAMVYLHRYTGAGGTGERVIEITMPPHEARLIGRALLDQADEIDPVGPLDEYRGQ